MRRLSSKLTVAAGVAIALVMTVQAGFRLEREADAYRADVRRDHVALGNALAETTATLVDRIDSRAAMDAVEEADRRRSRLRVRWIPNAPAERSVAEVDEDGQPFFVTRAPVHTLEGPRGVIEVRETLAPLERYAEKTVWRVVGLTAATVLACAVLIHVTGWLILDRRLRALVAGIRRIGRGDLSAALPRAGDDELGILAAEIDDMRARLAELQRTSREETHARIAALEQLRHADRLSTVGKLAAGVAHELGTPLNVVAARAKMIRTGESEPGEVTDDARVIEDQAARMTRIIRQVLDFARPRSPERIDQDVRDIAAGVLTMLGPQTQAVGVAASLTPGNRVLASVDGMQVQQLLTNLVMNAVQAQPEGGAIEVSVAASGDEVVIAVRDHGPGLAGEDPEQLFEPFFTTKPVGEGTGLGLSVVHGIVQEHGGTVTAAEAPGGGAVFTVRLPRKEPP